MGRPKWWPDLTLPVRLEVNSPHHVIIGRSFPTKTSKRILLLLDATTYGISHSILFNSILNFSQSSTWFALIAVCSTAFILFLDLIRTSSCFAFTTILRQSSAKPKIRINGIDILKLPASSIIFDPARIFDDKTMNRIE